MQRKPKAKKVLQGTFRPGENPENEPVFQVPVDAKNPPSYLTAYAKKFWHEYVDMLIDQGILTEADWENFTNLCEVVGMLHEAREAVYHYTDEDGKKKKRTLAQYMEGRNSQTCLELNTLHKMRDQFRALSAEFGMNAVARNRISIQKPKGEEVDPLQSMREGVK